MKKYIIYIRVSTQKQGSSGLGLAAQKATCMKYIESVGGELINTYEEIQSGANPTRPRLWAAIKECKGKGATLVFAKLDRLARDVEFTFRVINEGIDIHFCDMPVVNTMILGVFASVAQYERELISARTKAALAAAKAQGRLVGNRYGVNLDNARRASIMARRESMWSDPDKRATWVALRRCTNGFTQCDVMAFTQTAELLKDIGVKTPSGAEPDMTSMRAAYYRLKYSAEKLGMTALQLVEEYINRAKETTTVTTIKKLSTCSHS